MRAGVWGAIAGATGVVGLLFLLLALFIWFSSRYDVLTACVVLGLLLIIFALGAALALALVRRRPDPPATEPRVKAAGPWWLEPWVIGGALQVLRIVGARRTAVLLVAATTSGFLLSTIQTQSAEPRPPDQAFR